MQVNKCGRRVVVTGLGIVCPLGVGVKNAWNALLAGKSGVIKLDTPEYKTLPCRVGNITSLNNFLILVREWHNLWSMIRNLTDN